MEDTAIDALEAATLEDAATPEPKGNTDGGQLASPPDPDSASEADVQSNVEWGDAAYSLYKSVCKAAEQYDERLAIPDEDIRHTSQLLGRVMEKRMPQAAASMPELLLVASITATWGPRVAQLQSSDNVADE